MSENVIIVLMVCLTVIFISLILAVVIRWVCIVIFSHRSSQPIVNEKYLTIEEFEEYESMVSDALKRLEDKLDDKQNG